MRLKNILFIHLILLTFPLFGQSYGSYDISFTHSAPAGIAALGVGLDEPGSNLYNNPSLLASKSKYIVDGGIALSTNQSKWGYPKPLSGGFFIPVGEKNGWGITGKETFYKNFPGGEASMSAYAYSFFWSHKLSDNWNASLGVGPSVVIRAGIQSNFSLSPTASLSYKNKNHLIGITAQSPGKFRLEGYRGADSLKERLPEFAAIGYSYIMRQILIYSEARKIFWEKSSFQLNNGNSRPNLERGLGAELKLSVGIQYNIKNSPFQIRSGVETGGFYDEKGVNRRAAGIATGFTWKAIQDDEGNVFSIHFSVLNYSIFSKKGGRLPETIFYLSVGYLF